MLFGTVLLAATLAAAAARRNSAGWRDHARVGLAMAMAVAGASHLLAPDPFVQHLPEWIPGREAAVFASGLAEIAFGAALLTRRRVLAGRVLALYLAAVWPANVYVAVAGVEVDGQPGGVYPWVRLPLQAVFIAWALWSTATDDRSDPGGRHRHGTDTRQLVPTTQEEVR